MAESLYSLDAKENASRMDADTTRPARQRALLPTSLDTAETAALKARISNLENLYHPAEMRLVPNSQDSEHHSYVNRGDSHASGLDNDNALITVHFHIYNEMAEKNEDNPAKWLAGRLAMKTSSRTVQCLT